MKIIDGFTFYNELDMLEYRLELHYPYIDYFIIVEATRTHVGNPKPLFYKENIHRFAKYTDKIIHVIIDDLMPNPKHDRSKEFKDEVWLNENKQRNGIDLGIKQLLLDDSDYIIISDLDELMNPAFLKAVKEGNINVPFVNIEQDMYYYSLNYKYQYKWLKAKLVKYDFYTSILNRTPQECREIDSDYVVYNAGWHLSYFGDVDFIKNKLQNFSHQEYNTPEYVNDIFILQKIKNGKDLFSNSRENGQMQYIPLEKNENLPPLYNIYLPLHKYFHR